MIFYYNFILIWFNIRYIRVIYADYLRLAVYDYASYVAIAGLYIAKTHLAPNRPLAHQGVVWKQVLCEVPRLSKLVASLVYLVAAQLMHFFAATL